MVRYATTETDKILFAGLCDESPSAGAVTVYVYVVDSTDGTLDPVLTGTCRQAGASELYGYSIAEYNLGAGSFPTDEAEYVWYMANTDTGTHFASGYFIVGGYPEGIQDYSTEFDEIDADLDDALAEIRQLTIAVSQLGGSPPPIIYPGSSVGSGGDTSAEQADYSGELKKLGLRIEEVRSSVKQLGEHLKKRVD
jgi:hypothetical protein